MMLFALNILVKDFRENMDAEKGYLQGRFDAVPIIDTSVANINKLIRG